MNLLQKYAWQIAGLALGAIGGFFYWKYVGCLSGSCMITSVWHNSTAYGALMGALGASTLKDFVKKDKQAGDEPAA